VELYVRAANPVILYFQEYANYAQLSFIIAQYAPLRLYVSPALQDIKLTQHLNVHYAQISWQTVFIAQIIQHVQHVYQVMSLTV
jgi:hypothetical protein